MNTYSDLENVVLAYLQRNVDVSELFPGVVDESALDAKVRQLVLRGVNNAQRQAEHLHDFVKNQVSAVATIKAGSSIKTNGLIDVETGEVVDINVLTDVTFEGCPVTVMSKRGQRKLMFKQKQVGRVMVVRYGDRLRLEPDLDEDIEVGIEGYRRMVDFGSKEVYMTDEVISGVNLQSYAPNGPALIGSYTTADSTLFEDCVGESYVVKHPSGSGLYPHYGVRVLSNATYSGVYWSLGFDDPALDGVTIALASSTIAKINPSGSVRNLLTKDTSWMLEDGFEYLQWASMCEVNHLVQQFLPRAEGSLVPPTRSRDAAFDALVRWDADLAGSHYSGNLY